jgi:outer membrane receptor protein involved in Fe transport
MRLLLISLLLQAGYIACAQKYTIQGQVTDSLEHPLPAATVVLMNPGDSTLVTFSIADSNGRFVLKNAGSGRHILKITSLGYNPYDITISPPKQGSVLDLGILKLQAIAKTLQAIEVSGDRPPVIVKKDTIEFNAESFQTKPNAVVEDLLKKLPGIEVDNEGNITAQGEQVKNVTVDGKKFFGSDPKMATRNLPADAVETVQVFDRLSDQAEFTGIDDGQRQKTINLALKAGRRNATFGKMEGGAGTDERRKAKANLNKFSKDQQLSFLAMANNVNQSGFGMDEYLNFTGGSRQMMQGGGVRIRTTDGSASGIPLNTGRGSGIMNTYAGGANINNEFNKNTEINSSYFYNYLQHYLDQSTLRENFLQDGNFNFNEHSTEDNANSNHRANLTLDHKIDSANTLRLTTTFTANETESEQASISENVGADQSLISRNERQYFSEGLGTALNSRLLYRHRFGKPGRSMTASLQLNVNKNATNGLLDAVNTFYTEDREVIQKQEHDQSTDNLSYGALVSYTEPLGRQKYLEVNYNFQRNLNDVNRDVYDINNGETDFNEMLSNQYASDYQYHRAGINLRAIGSDYNFVLGTSFQQTQLEGDLKLLEVETSKSFQNVLPALRFTYNFSTTKHLQFDYETSVNEPEIQQLQPVIDNSDPFNIYAGNPDLRPEYSQSWRLNFNTFNPVNFMTFFAFADVDYKANAIINAQTIDERLVRTIQPVNVDKNLSIRGQLHLGIPVSAINSRFNVGLNFRNLNSVAILNAEANDITQQTKGGTFRYSYDYKDIFDVSLSANLSRQQTRYEFNQPDQNFINSTYSVESNLSFLKHYAFNATFDYLVYKNRAQDFTQVIPLLNMSVSRFVFKNKSGEIRLSVDNLLDKIVGVSQTANINYIEQVTSNSIGRYFMVSLIYSLNKQLNPMSQRRHGPMIRITR